MCHVRCAGPTSACLRLPALRCLQACGKPLPSIHRLHDCMAVGWCQLSADDFISLVSFWIFRVGLSLKWELRVILVTGTVVSSTSLGLTKLETQILQVSQSSLEWLQVPEAVGTNPPLHTEKCWKENTPQNLTGDSMQWKLHDQSHRCGITFGGDTSSLMQDA